MNRKRESKLKKIASRMNPYDDMENWCKGDFGEPPWSRERIAAFQKQIDSAFGAENAIVLVWSGDRSYGEEICDGPWDSFGNPIGKFNRKPVLLFGQFPVNADDYIYVMPPRWCLMEAHHGSQLTDWSDAAWVSDENCIGGRKRIRPKIAPEFYYVHLMNGVMSLHERPLITGDQPPCCKRMGKRICYGKYREPDESDLARIRGIREDMDHWGIAQRADEPRSAKMLMMANLATTHFMKEAKYRQHRAAKEMILSDIGAFCGDILTKKGSTMSHIEMERIVTKALDQEEEERFSQD